MINETAQVAVQTIQLVMPTFNSSIPLMIQTSSATNWSQFVLTLLVSAGLLFFILFSSGMNMFANLKVKMALRKFVSMTKRPCIVIKHDGGGLFDFSMIQRSTLKKIMVLMNKFKGRAFDLILHTPGGEVFSSLLISKLLKQYPGHIRAVVPLFSMSGGTLLALSCNELYMAPNAVIGPTDPQLGSLFKSASARGWNEVIRKKKNKASDDSIVFDFEGKHYTKSIKNHLTSHMRIECNPKMRKQFIEYMTSGNIEHAHPLTSCDLQSFGICTKTLSPKAMKPLIKILALKTSEEIFFRDFQ